MEMAEFFTSFKSRKNFFGRTLAAMRIVKHAVFGLVSGMEIRRNTPRPPIVLFRCFVAAFV